MDDTTSQAVRVFGTQADMSALVQAKVADAANRAKSEFLSRMSHELRTPLNAILGFGKLMSLDEGLTASQLDYLNEILQAGRHLLGLVNEVLDLHQIEAGRMTVEVKDLLLAPLAQDNVDLLEPLALAAGVSLHMNIAPDTVVRADPKRLSQVLINLVSNAVKYNREGGFVRLESAHLADGRVQITVVDNGLGISDTAQAMIFQPFERGDADDTPVQGTGLGLTLTRKLVDLMDGEIGFESQDGQGSRFWVVLNAGKL
jgi:signal transduction histidine kinase